MKAITIILIIATLASCGGHFLDVKRDRSESIPHTLEDCEALLSGIIYNRSCRELGLIGADEYNLLDGNYHAVREAYQRNAHIWAQEVYEGKDINDWNLAYQRIMYANLALGVLEGISDNSTSRLYSEIKGQALYHRAYNYYQLAQLFCAPYNSDSLGLAGLPLRLESDATLQVKRSTLGETYDQVIRDLESASELLDDSFESPLQPSRRAVFGLLSRIYLIMGAYEQSLEYAEKCLSYGLTLVDFASVDTTQRYSFTSDFGLSNPEVIFFDALVRPQIMSTISTVDSTLYQSYSPGDYRRACFFFSEKNGNMTFKGSYSGDNSFFTGLALDEILLIRAETKARMGLLDDALADLNELLASRIDNRTFVPVEAASEREVIALILEERKKELFFRGARWEDIRRLAKDPEHAITLERAVDGTVYRLTPGDLRYTWPIPDKEVVFGQIQQNPR